MGFLDPDPRDVGCDRTHAVLDAYVDEIVCGRDAAAGHPGVAAHLRACPPCLADCEGLLAAARAPVPALP